MHKKINTLVVLLEEEDQYNYFSSLQSQEFSNISICAITPFALDFCRKNGLNYFVPEDTFTEKLFYDFKVKSEDIIKENVEKLNEFSRTVGMNEIKFPLEIGNYFYFQLYVVLGALHFKSFLLKNIIQYKNPDQVIVFQSSKEVKTILNFRPDPLNINASLLRNSEFKNIIQVITCLKKDEQSNATIVVKLKNILRAIIEKGPSKFKNLYYLLRNGGSVTWQSLFFKKKETVLFLGSLYNWKYCLKRISSNYNISFYINFKINSTRNTSSKFQNIVSKLDLNFMGFYYAEILAKQFAMIEGTMTCMIKSFLKLQKEATHCDIVLASIFTFPFELLVSHIAQVVKKPQIIFQHGEMNLFRDSLFSSASEMLYTDYYFSFGKNVSSKYHYLANQHPNLKEVFEVGSPGLDALNLKNQSKEYILYASGKYLLNAAPFIHTIGLDARLYEAQLKITGFLETLVSHSIWKLSNTPFFNSVPVEVNRVQKISNEKSFMQLLAHSSIVILDSPATTCIETCATEKPLFVLLNRIKWFEEAEVLLQKRAIVAYSPEELIKEVDYYLKTGNYKADLKNREFVKAYGTFLVTSVQQNEL